MSAGKGKRREKQDANDTLKNKQEEPGRIARDYDRHRLKREMIIKHLIGRKVSCKLCGYSNLQDYFTLQNLGGPITDFVCEDCRTASFAGRFKANFNPQRDDIIGVAFTSLAMLIICVLSVLIGGAK